MREMPMMEALNTSISSFLNLQSRANITAELNLKYYNYAETILKLIVPVVNSISESGLKSEEEERAELLRLEQTVDELQVIFQSWKPLSSNVNFVILVEPLITKLESGSVNYLELLKASDHHLPDELCSPSLESLIGKIINLELFKTSSLIKMAAKGEASSEMLSDMLCLRSNQEILIEAVALEKLKENAEQAENSVEAVFIDEMISLVTKMHERLVLMKQSQNSSPVTIPSDFCCPLSLELMMDPVIVSSGQTYERTFIKSWIDLGLNVCPKTRQPLAHTNLIPNFTVKALIANWCETNNVKPIDPKKMISEALPPKGNQALSREGSSELSPSSSSNDINANTDPEGESSELFQNHSCPLDRSSDAMASQSLNRSSSATGALSSPSASHQADDTANGDVSKPSAPISSLQKSTELLRRNTTLWRRPTSDRLIPRIVSSSFNESRPDLSEVERQVQSLVQELQNPSTEMQRHAVSEIRLLAKHNMENRIIIANCGAIEFLVKLLTSEDSMIQQEAVTALLNLSINDINKKAIADAGAIEPLIHVLKTGTPEARENSAATLFSLSVVEDNKVTIGRSGAIGPLVELLGNGTLRGKKDAATALFNLSIHHENKARIVQAGAVKHLVDLMDPAAGMVDKAVAVLANLATIQEGKFQIYQDNGIRVLVEVVELGSARGKENAAAALLQLCTTNSKICNMVLQEGAVPPLVALSQSGTPRAKEKAQTLLTYFRSQRHGNAGRS